MSEAWTPEGMYALPLRGSLDDYPMWRRASGGLLAPRINNPDGSISTHLMAAEIDDNGVAWAFPTIVQLPNGKLKKFDDARAALDYTKRTGDAVPFRSIDEAVNFTKTYKQHIPLQNYGLLNKQPDQ